MLLINDQPNELTIPQKAQVLNGKFDSITFQETIRWSMERIVRGDHAYICTVNVAILMLMRSHQRLRKFIENADLCVADGKPIVWLSHWLNTPLPERVTGIDLIEELAKQAEIEGLGIYLLGSTHDRIKAAAQTLTSKYPQLKVYYADGYFPLDQAAELVQRINESGAQILLVGMGVPRQETFLNDNWLDLKVNLAIGVGGSFDVLAGFKKRAPYWIQEVGLEWLYRLLQEPGRLGRRYLVTNTQFIYEALKVLLVQRLRYSR